MSGNMIEDEDLRHAAEYALSIMRRTEELATADGLDPEYQAALVTLTSYVKALRTAGMTVLVEPSDGGKQGTSELALVRRPDELPRYDAAKQAWADYWSARARLEALGAVRADRSVAGDFAEWLVAQMCGYTRATNGVQPVYDATDETGHTYQIKARLVGSLQQSTSLDFPEPSFPVDFLVAAFMSPTGGVLAVVRIPYAEVMARARHDQGSRRLRWTKALFDAPWVEVLWRKVETEG